LGAIQRNLGDVELEVSLMRLEHASYALRDRIGNDDWRAVLGINTAHGSIELHHRLDVGLIQRVSLIFR